MFGAAISEQYKLTRKHGVAKVKAVEARKHLQKYIQLATGTYDDVFVYSYTHLLETAGEIDQVINTLEDCIAKDPSNINLHRYLYDIITKHEPDSYEHRAGLLHTISTLDPCSVVLEDALCILKADALPATKRKRDPAAKKHPGQSVTYSSETALTANCKPIFFGGVSLIYLYFWKYSHFSSRFLHPTCVGLCTPSVLVFAPHMCWSLHPTCVRRVGLDTEGRSAI